MIKSVKVTNQRNESVIFDLYRPELSGYWLMNIGGLAPTRATVNISNFAISDGGIFNSSRAEARNITLSVLYYDNEKSIERLRQDLYILIPPKEKVEIVFNTDIRSYVTTGYVESHESSIFSERTGASISILCEDAYFENNISNTILFYGDEPEFEFPFSNESLTEKLIEFGKLNRYQIKNIFYEGEEPAGLVISLHATGPVSNPIIFNQYTREQISINSDFIEASTGSGIVAGDEIVISTVNGNKRVILVRNGIAYNIINCIGRHPDWLKISPGNNIFGFTFEGDTGSMSVTISYTEKYKGI